MLDSRDSDGAGTRATEWARAYGAIAVWTPILVLFAAMAPVEIRAPGTPWAQFGYWGAVLAGMALLFRAGVRMSEWDWSPGPHLRRPADSVRILATACAGGLLALVPLVIVPSLALGGSTDGWTGLQAGPAVLEACLGSVAGLILIRHYPAFRRLDRLAPTA